MKRFNNKKMKKIILMFIFTLSFYGCSSNTNEEKLKGDVISNDLSGNLKIEKSTALEFKEDNVVMPKDYANSTKSFNSESFNISYNTNGNNTANVSNRIINGADGNDIAGDLVSNNEVAYIIHSINIQKLTVDNFKCGSNINASNKLEYSDLDEGNTFKSLTETNSKSGTNFYFAKCPIVAKMSDATSSPDSRSLLTIKHNGNSADKTNLKLLTGKTSGLITVTSFIVNKNQSDQQAITDVVNGIDTVKFFVSNAPDTYIYKTVEDNDDKQKRYNGQNSLRQKNESGKKIIDIGGSGDFSFKLSHNIGGGQSINNSYAYNGLYLLQNVDVSIKKGDGVYDGGDWSYIKDIGNKNLSLYSYKYSGSVGSKTPESILNFYASVKENQLMGAIFSLSTLKDCDDAGCINGILSDDVDVRNNQDFAHIYLSKNQNELIDQSKLIDLNIDEYFTENDSSDTVANNEGKVNKNVYNIKSEEKLSTKIKFKIKKNKNNIEPENTKLNIIVIADNVEYAGITDADTTGKEITMDATDKNKCNVKKISPEELTTGMILYAMTCDFDIDQNGEKTLSLTLDKEVKLRNVKSSKYGSLVFWPVVSNSEDQVNINNRRGIGHGSAINVFDSGVNDVAISKGVKNVNEKYLNGDPNYEYQDRAIVYSKGDEKTDLVKYKLAYKNNFGTTLVDNIKIHDVYINLNALYADVNVKAISDANNTTFSDIENFGKLAHIVYGGESILNFSNDTKDEWGWNHITQAFKTNKNCNTSLDPYCKINYAEANFKKNKKAKNGIILNYAFIENENDINYYNNFSETRVIINPKDPVIYVNGIQKTEVISYDDKTNTKTEEEKLINIICYTDSSGVFNSTSSTSNCEAMLKATDFNGNAGGTAYDFPNINFGEPLKVDDEIDKNVINNIFTVVDASGKTIANHNDQISIELHDISTGNTVIQGDGTLKSSQSVLDENTYNNDGKIKFIKDGEYYLKITVKYDSTSKYVSWKFKVAPKTTTPATTGSNNNGSFSFINPSDSTENTSYITNFNEEIKNMSVVEKTIQAIGNEMGTYNFISLDCSGHSYKNESKDCEVLKNFPAFDKAKREYKFNGIKRDEFATLVTNPNSNYTVYSLDDFNFNRSNLYFSTTSDNSEISFYFSIMTEDGLSILNYNNGTAEKPVLVEVVFKNT